MGAVRSFIDASLFEPQDIEALNVAFLNACAAVGADANPGLKEQVANRIVSLALAGERDPTNLYLRFMENTGGLTPLARPRDVA